MVKVTSDTHTHILRQHMSILKTLEPIAISFPQHPAVGDPKAANHAGYCAGNAPSPAGVCCTICLGVTTQTK